MTRDLAKASGAVLLALAMALACSPARPSLEEWREVWSQMLAAVPDPDVMESDETRAHCDHLLATTRELRGKLLPAPDRALDAPVFSWLEEAGHIAIDCPAVTHRLEAFREEVRILRILGAEIDAAIALEQELADPSRAAGN